MPFFSRDVILQKLRDKLSDGGIIIAAGAGTGLSARFEEKGGADIIIVFSSGFYRMHGLSSLAAWMPYGNANDIAISLGKKFVIPAVNSVPVLCGLNASDPTYRKEDLIKIVRESGFSGVINFPTLGMIDGKFRMSLEETGISYEQEVELIKMAANDDLFTVAFAFNPDEAKMMVEAGCDVLSVHVGLTTGGSVGLKSVSPLVDAIKKTEEIYLAAKGTREDVIVLCHGGPISSPDDVKEVLKHIPVDGFLGASSIERIPAEEAIYRKTLNFSSIKKH